MAETTGRSRLFLLLLLAVALGSVGEYSALGPQRRANAAAAGRLAAMRHSNELLRPLASQLARLALQNRQLNLAVQAAEAQLPAQRDSDDFLRQLDTAARAAGVAIRAVSAQPVERQALFLEAPYSVQLDGSFTAVLGFYDRLAHLPQLMQVSDWTIDALSVAPGGAKQYRYSPGATIHATCKVSTYFSPAGSDATSNEVKP